MMQAGRGPSFEDEVARLLPEVMGFFSRRIPNDAEDCSAETLVAALSARASFRKQASVRTFFRIAHRVLARRRALLARQTREIDLDKEPLQASGELSSSSGPSEPILEEMIVSALALMESAPKEMLELTFMEGKSRRELAAHLQLSSGTVAHRLQRAEVLH